MKFDLKLLLMTIGSVYLSQSLQSDSGGNNRISPSSFTSQYWDNINNNINNHIKNNNNINNDDHRYNKKELSASTTSLGLGEGSEGGEGTREIRNHNASYVRSSESHSLKNTGFNPLPSKDIGDSNNRNTPHQSLSDDSKMFGADLSQVDKDMIFEGLGDI